MTSGANTSGMVAVILIDIIGLNAFVKGYGIQLFFMGLGHLHQDPHDMSAHQNKQAPT